MIRRSIAGFLLGATLMLPMAAQSAVFSIVVMTDSQFYAEFHPEILEAQIDWIVANQAAENIAYVAQTGDLKDDQACDDRAVFFGTGAGRTEWQIADDAYVDLDTANIPYAVLPGNHDFDPVAGACPFGPGGPLTQYNTRFGPGRFAGDPFYGGNRITGSNEDNYTLFESNGVKFISINLAYRPDVNAVAVGNPEFAWADNLLQTNPDRLGIVTSHYFLNTADGVNAAMGPYGQAVYDALKNNQNLFMMLSGHWWGEAWLTETTDRGSFPPVQALMANYQGHVFPDDGDGSTPPNTPNPALINFSSLPAQRGGLGTLDAGFMRIMRFDTDTGQVDIETFIPPVVPIKNRTGTIVSTYTANNNSDVGEFTASNLGYSYLGYAPTEIVSCGTNNVSGDRIFRGFYHPSYPGSTLDTVELYISSRDPGSHRIRLEARQNAYNGALIASDAQTRTLSGDGNDNESFLFDFDNVAVTPNSTIAFTLTLESQPPGSSDQVFFAVSEDQYPIGGGGAGDCDMIQTSGTTPPLDNLRRNGLWIRISGIGVP